MTAPRAMRLRSAPHSSRAMQQQEQQLLLRPQQLAMSGALPAPWLLRWPKVLAGGARPEQPASLPASSCMPDNTTDPSVTAVQAPGTTACMHSLPVLHAAAAAGKSTVAAQALTEAISQGSSSDVLARAASEALPGSQVRATCLEVHTCCGRITRHTHLIQVNAFQRL